MIINKEININNIKKLELEIILKNKKFPVLGKSYNDTKESYDYLLSMPLYNLTKEKIDELQKLMNDKEIEYNELNNKSITTIWLEELDILTDKYNKWINKKLESNIINKKKKLS